MVQYIENHFVESYYPTIESTFSKTINYNGVDYDCDIIDTAGQVRSPNNLLASLKAYFLRSFQDEFTLLNSKHAIGIHGYILVYSVTSRKSFEMVQVVYDKIINFCGINQIPCVIVGSKTDLQKRCAWCLLTPCLQKLILIVKPPDRYPRSKARSWPSRPTPRLWRRAQRQIPTSVRVFPPRYRGSR